MTRDEWQEWDRERIKTKADLRLTSILFGLTGLTAAAAAIVQAVVCR